MPQPAIRPFPRHWWIGVALAATGMLFSMLVAMEQVRSARKIESARLAQAAKGASDALVRRIDAYTEIAFGLRSLFMVNPQTSRKAFNDAVERLEVEKRYPGINNVAFTRYVIDAQKAAFEARVRADRSLDPAGHPQFAIRPPGRRDEYFVADYLWPWEENRVVHGLDISTQPANLASMEFARYTGQPTASGPFDLVQEKTARTGFVVRVPVFSGARADAVKPGPDSRFLGSVAVTLRVADLFGSLEREGVLQGLQVQLKDEGASFPGALPGERREMYSTLADARPHAGDYDGELQLYGRRWRLCVRPEGSLLSVSERQTPLLLGIAGSLISVLLGVMVGLFGRDRARALAQVASTDEALRDSELRWRFAIEGSGDGLWDWNLVDDRLFYSARWLEMLGLSPDDIGNTPEDWRRRMHPLDRDMVLRAVRAHLKGEIAQLELEHRVLCKDGQVKWVLGRGLVVQRDARGHALRMVGTYTDITRRKLAEFALQESEARLVGVIDSAMDAIVSIDQDHRIVLFNAAAERMFGHKQQRMLGQPLDLLLPQTARTHHAGHLERFARDLIASRSMGATAEPPRRLTALRASGEEFPIEASISRVETPGHQVFTVIIRDVTERDRAFADLRSSEYYLREAQRAGQIGVYGIDIASGAWRSSDVLDQIFGVNAQYDHSADGWRALMPPDSAERVRLHFREVLREGKRFDLEYQIVRQSDGALRWVHGLGDLQYGPDGRALRLSGTVQDITERRDSAAQLQQSLNLLHKLSDQVPGVLFQLTLDAQNHLAVTFANRASAELLGVTPEAVARDAGLILSRIHPDDVAQFSQSLEASARLLHDWHTSFRARLDGQDYRWRMAQARPERLADGSTVWHGFISDITERLDAEARLRESNDLLEQRVTERTQELSVARDGAEAAKQSRGDFLAKMSHEIRTPLNAVLGMTYLAIKGHPEPRQMQYLRKIQGSGEHLLRIINDILDYSKIDAGKLELETGALNLRPLLGQLLQMYEPKAQEKGLMLALEVAPDVPDTLIGDRLRLEQVLINYLGNALKFTTQGGVWLRVNRLAREDAPAAISPDGQAGAEAPGAAPAAATRCWLRFEVQDTGPGLSQPDIARLFQSFEQGDNSTTRRFGGTGLGLAICRQLAELMGGEVGVGAELGAGSSFWFDVPLGLADGTQVVPAHQGDITQWIAGLRGLRVLVVDDNDLNLEVAKGILEEAALQVAMASNGEQALAILREQPFDCVLMDMHMPVMDGLQATRAIQADLRLFSIPVIAMTANARREDHLKCLEAGMVDVVVKPFTPYKLFETLARWATLDTGLVAGDPGPGNPVGVSVPPAPAIVPQEQDFAVYDASALTRMVGNNPAAVHRILEKFLRSAGECRESLLAARADARALADTAHKLKSSARAVGAMRLGQACERLEDAGRSGNLAACATLLEPLLVGITQAEAAVRAVVEIPA